MRRQAIVIVLGLLAACGSGGEPVYDADDLKRLVLQPKDAPEHTSYDAGSSGVRPLDRVTADKKYQRRLAGAGFQTSYFALFHNTRLTIIANSFAMLFKDDSGAIEGLREVERHIRQDGEDLRDIPAEDLGSESFGLAGVLEPGLHPGFAYVWRRGNAIFGLIGAGPANTIRENAVRKLAEKMEARAS